MFQFTITWHDIFFRGQYIKAKLLHFTVSLFILFIYFIVSNGGVVMNYGLLLGYWPGICLQGLGGTQIISTRIIGIGSRFELRTCRIRVRSITIERACSERQSYYTFLKYMLFGRGLYGFQVLCFCVSSVCDSPVF